MKQHYSIILTEAHFYGDSMNSKFKEKLIAFFAYDCICCGRAVNTDGKIFCKECENELFSKDIIEENGIISVINYKSESARSLILTMKDYKIKDVFSYSAKLIASKIRERNIPSLDEYYISFAPRNIKSLVRKRFDQSYEIGKCLSVELFGSKRRCIPLFRGSLFSKEQKTLDYEGRKTNVGKHMNILPFVNVPRKLIILDDVTTTGATLLALREIALKNGAEECILCSVAKQNLE